MILLLFFTLITLAESYGFDCDFYKATFTGEVEGTIKIEKDPTTPGFLRLEVDLSASKISHDHLYHVHATVVGEDNNCTATGDHFDPFSVENEQYECNPNNVSTCYFGDLSGKHGSIDLKPKASSQIYSYSDAQLNLTELANKAIVIHGEDQSLDRIACANLEPGFFPLFQAVNFTDVYYGAMIFRSRSDGLLGIVHNLDTTQSTSSGHRYHVHTSPITPTADGKANCFAAGAHFDPLQRENFYSSVPCNPSDVDTCFYGDLEGKYGQLTLPSTRSVADSQLTVPSLEDRSVVIHEEQGSLDYMICDTLKPDQEFKSAIATFTGSVSGTVTFQTHFDGSVRVGFTLQNQDGTTTTNHDYHLHLDNVLGSDCASAGGHYDPTLVENALYNCNPNDVSTCYSGDLSGKHGSIDLPAEGVIRDTTFSVSELVGRSIVVHASNDKPRFDCATIFPTAVVPELVAARFDTEDGMYGYTIFRTRSDGSVSVLTSLTSVQGSASDVFNWEVRDNGIPSGQALASDCDVSGEVFDPTSFGAGHCNPHNLPHSCKHGDLVGKFGAISQGSKTVIDPQLVVPDIIDRSVVFSQSSTAVACANIDQFPVLNYAEVEFQGTVEGKIMFRDTRDGLLITHFLRSETMEFLQWFVYADAVDSNCNQAGDVFDPFNLDRGTENCNDGDPATCIAGDLSGKHGDIKFPTSTTVLDPTLKASDLIGRSIVFKDTSLNRVACSNIYAADYVPDFGVVEFGPGIIAFRNRVGPGTSVVINIPGQVKDDVAILLTDDCSPASNVITNLTTVDLPAQTTVFSSLEVRDILDKYVMLQTETAILFCEAVSEVDSTNRLELDAFAIFEGSDSVTGTMDFQWRNATEDGMPGFFLNLALQRPNETFSKRHAFHVHDDALFEGGICSTTHFDPANVEDSNYACSANNAEDTCYIGDLSGRYELKLAFPITTTVLDTQLMLSDIIGRAIVIHVQEGSKTILTCATIYPVPNTFNVTTSLPTASPTRLTTRSPTTPSPTRMPTAFVSQAPSKSAAPVVDAVEGEESSGGSNLGWILGITLPLGLLLCCAPVMYYFYNESQFESIHRKSCNLPEFEDCDELCPCCTCFHVQQSQTFHLGRQATEIPPTSYHKQKMEDLDNSEYPIALGMVPVSMSTFRASSGNFSMGAEKSDVELVTYGLPPPKLPPAPPSQSLPNKFRRSTMNILSEARKSEPPPIPIPPKKQTLESADPSVAELPDIANFSSPPSSRVPNKLPPMIPPSLPQKFHDLEAQSSFE